MECTELSKLRYLKERVYACQGALNEAQTESKRAFWKLELSNAKCDLAKFRQSATKGSK
jgi:hypothetical protein